MSSISSGDKNKRSQAHSLGSIGKNKETRRKGTHHLMYQTPVREANQDAAKEETKYESPPPTRPDLSL